MGFDPVHLPAPPEATKPAQLSETQQSLPWSRVPGVVCSFREHNSGVIATVMQSDSAFSVSAVILSAALLSLWLQEMQGFPFTRYRRGLVL